MSTKHKKSVQRSQRRQLKQACEEGSLVGIIGDEEAAAVIKVQVRQEGETLADLIERRRREELGQQSANLDGSRFMQRR